MNFDNPLDAEEIAFLTRQLAEISQRLVDLRGFAPDDMTTHAQMPESASYAETLRPRLRLAVERRRLEETQRIANVGSWESDLRCSKADGSYDLEWSAQTHLIFGTVPGTFIPTHKEFLARVHPEDRAGVARAFAASLNSIGHQYIEHRIFPPDGAEKIIEERWEIVRDIDGTPLRGIGTCQDVTEQRLIERRNRQGEMERELLEASIAQVKDVVIITQAAPLDEPGPTITFVNDALAEITGYTREELIGKSPRMLQGENTDRKTLDRVRDALSRMEPVHAELLNYKKSGASYWLDMNIAPVRIGGRRPSHFVAVARDITERKVREQTLSEKNSRLEATVEVRTAELELARDESERANKSKSAFLATVSHEIRTPMNGVIGMAEVLRQSKLEDRQVEMVDLIRDSAYSLLSLVDDVLDFSKAEAGRLATELAPLGLAEHLEKAFAMVAHGATSQGVSLRLFVDPAIPDKVLGDALRLQQVIVNLVNNAVKFSSGREQRGFVSLRAVLLQERAGVADIGFTVTDNGMGMDARTLALIFTPFAQADASTSRRFGGTGLGLAISDVLVRLMGGEIQVRSCPGSGSRFTFTLPFSIAEPNVDIGASPAVVADMHCHIVGSEQPLGDDVAAYLFASGATISRVASFGIATAAQRDSDHTAWIVLPDIAFSSREELRVAALGHSGGNCCFVVLTQGRRSHPRVESPGFVSLDADVMSRRSIVQAVGLASGRLRDDCIEAPTEALSRTGREVPLSGEVSSARGRRILIAEDDEINQLVIERQLQMLGFRGDVACDGSAALEQWRTGHYGLLLTDLKMPKMDGFRLVAAIRAEEGVDYRMPIIALTANALPHEEACRACGMDGYLTKPVSLRVLKAAIEHWLASGKSKVMKE